MATELKPCPFCGGEGNFQDMEKSPTQLDVWVECDDCGAATHPAHQDDRSIEECKTIAASYWNKRAMGLLAVKEALRYMEKGCFDLSGNKGHTDIEQSDFMKNLIRKAKTSIGMD